MTLNVETADKHIFQVKIQSIFFSALWSKATCSCFSSCKPKPVWLYFSIKCIYLHLVFFSFRKPTTKNNCRCIYSEAKQWMMNNQIRTKAELAVALLTSSCAWKTEPCHRDATSRLTSSGFFSGKDSYLELRGCFLSSFRCFLSVNEGLEWRTWQWDRCVDLKTVLYPDGQSHPAL